MYIKVEQTIDEVINLYISLWYKKISSSHNPVCHITSGSTIPFVPHYSTCHVTPSTTFLTCYPSRSLPAIFFYHTPISLLRPSISGPFPPLVTYLKPRILHGPYTTAVPYYNCLPQRYITLAQNYATWCQTLYNFSPTLRCFTSTSCSFVPKLCHLVNYFKKYI